MKIVKSIICASLFALMLSSCTSTKNQETVPVDDYDSQSVSSDTDVNLNKTANQKVNTNKKNEKNAFEKFFTFGNKDDFVYGDEFSVFTPGTLGGIKQKKS